MEAMIGLVREIFQLNVMIYFYKVLVEKVLVDQNFFVQKCIRQHRWQTLDHFRSGFTFGFTYRETNECKLLMMDNEALRLLRTL